MIMDTAQIALIIVGLTEVIKQAFNISNRFVKVLVSFLIAAALTCLVYFLGDKSSPILMGLTAFASATLSYDIIIKRIMTNDKGSFDPDGDNSYPRNSDSVAHMGHTDAASNGEGTEGELR